MCRATTMATEGGEEYTVDWPKGCYFYIRKPKDSPCFVFGGYSPVAATAGASPLVTNKKQPISSPADAAAGGSSPPLSPTKQPQTNEAEQLNLVRNIGDALLSIDGISLAGKHKDEVVALLQRKKKQEVIRLCLRESKPQQTPGPPPLSPPSTSQRRGRSIKLSPSASDNNDDSHNSSYEEEEGRLQQEIAQHEATLERLEQERREHERLLSEKKARLKALQTTEIQRMEQRLTELKRKVHTPARGKSLSPGRLLVRKERRVSPERGSSATLRPGRRASATFTGNSGDTTSNAPRRASVTFTGRSGDTSNTGKSHSAHARTRRFTSPPTREGAAPTRSPSAGAGSQHRRRTLSQMVMVANPKAPPASNGTSGNVAFFKQKFEGNNL